jgi:hypothetical protein
MPADDGEEIEHALLDRADRSREIRQPSSKVGEPLRLIVSLDVTKNLQ